MLRVEKLNQYYGESHTLWDVELDVPEGSCTCLMGRNGVGKTTLLKSIMGSLAVRSGWSVVPALGGQAGGRMRFGDRTWVCASVTALGSMAVTRRIGTKILRRVSNSTTRPNTRG